MEFTRILALAVLLFCVGLYGLFVRNASQTRVLSLAVALSAIALSLWNFNQYIRPAHTDGYLFGIILLIIAGAYVVFISGLTKDKHAPETLNAERLENTPSAIETEYIDSGSIESMDNYSSMGSLPFQVTLALVVIVGYLLARVSPVGFVAFLLGVVSLKFVLYKKFQEQQRISKPSDFPADALRIHEITSSAMRAMKSENLEGESHGE